MLTQDDNANIFTNQFSQSPMPPPPILDRKPLNINGWVLNPDDPNYIDILMALIAYMKSKQSED